MLNAYVTFCDVLGFFLFDIRIDSSFWHRYRCCHLISSAFLTSSFFWRSTMGIWECASVTCCIYLTRSFVDLPLLLLLFCILYFYKFLIASLFPYSNPSVLLLSYSSFLPDWCWFTFVSSRLFHCHFTAAGIWWVSFSVIWRVVQSNVSRKQKKAIRFVLQSWTFCGRRRSNCLFASAFVFVSIV